MKKRKITEAMEEMDGDDIAKDKMIITPDDKLKNYKTILKDI